MKRGGDNLSTNIDNSEKYCIATLSLILVDNKSFNWNQMRLTTSVFFAPQIDKFISKVDSSDVNKVTHPFNR